MELFDDDEDHDDDDDDESKAPTPATASKNHHNRRVRPKENGALQFHEGTEDALLIYVRTALQQQHHHRYLQQQQQQHPRLPHQPTANAVLQSIDAFCLDRHWMMHCGPQKGAVLEEFLLERYRAHQQQQYDGVGSGDGDGKAAAAAHEQQQSQHQQPFIIVELGSYCGYSAIRMAQALLLSSSSSYDSQSSSSEEKQLPTPMNSFHIYSIDVQPKLLRIAVEMTRLAGLDHCITYHLLRKNKNDNSGNHSSNSNDNDTTLHTLLQEVLDADEKGKHCTTASKARMIHFCLLDHAKDLYLSDLLQLERYGHLRRGSAVAADNVIFAHIDDYRHHVQSAAYLSTTLVAGPLEYQEEIPDGIELSVYVLDPPSKTDPPGPIRG